MTDYYLSTGISGKNAKEIVKNADINKARVKAWSMLEKYEKPVSVSRITPDGRDAIYLGEVRRWAIAYDRYGIDRTDIWACWVDKDGKEYSLLTKGNIRRE